MITNIEIKKVKLRKKQSELRRPIYLNSINLQTAKTNVMQIALKPTPVITRGISVITPKRLTRKLSLPGTNCLSVKAMHRDLNIKLVTVNDSSSEKIKLSHFLKCLTSS